MAAFNPPVDQQPQSPADYAHLLERERLLREISAEIAAADDLDAVLARVCAGVRRLLGADVAEVGLIDAAGETLETRYSDGRPEGLLSGARVPLRTSFTGQVVRARAPLAVEAVATAPEIPLHHRDLLVKAGIRSLAAAPMLAGDTCLGVLYASHRATTQFAADYLRQLAAMATQASIAVQKAQLRLQAERLLVLHEVSLALSHQTGREATLQAILASAVRLARADFAVIYQWQPERGELERVAQWGVDPATQRQVARGGVTLAAFEHGEVVVANDYPRHHLASSSGQATRAQASMAIPLRAPSYVGPTEQPLGVLTVGSTSNPHAFGPEEVWALSLFGDAAALAWANAQLAEEREARASELAKREAHLIDLQQMTRAITSNLRLDALLASLLESVVRLTSSANARIIVLNGPGPEPLVRAFGPGSALLEAMQGYTRPEQFMAETRQPLLANHARRHPACDSTRIRSLGVAHVIGAPLLIGEEIVGMLTASRVVGDAEYSRADLDLLAALAGQASVAVHNATIFERLRASEEHYRLLAENMPELVAMIDARGRYSYVNPVIERVLGYRREELVGQSAFAFLTAASAAEARRHFARAMQGEEAASTYELEIVARDGSLVPLEASIVTMLDAQGRPTGRMAVARDLRPRRLEQEQRARDEKLRAMGQLASGVAHDFNNALASIMGTLELIRLQHPDLEPFLDADLQVMEQAARGAAETVRRLQEYTRGDAGEERWTTTDAAVLLHDVVRLTQPRWRNAAQERGVAIECRVECAAGLRLRGSAPELREALTNLVFNAVDALPEGGVISLSARMVSAGEVGLTATGPVVEIAVQDNGVGMAPDVLQRATEPFFTTKGVRGSGLGLSMVYGAARRHRGELRVESRPSAGCRVALLLPQEERPRLLGSEQPECAELPAPPGLRLLVVDDDPVQLRMLSAMLEREGHCAQTAGSAAEALALLQGIGRGGDTPFDLVLTDIGMPDMNGWDLARAIRRLDGAPPLVAVTGWGHTLDPAEVQSHNFRGVVSKPYTLAELRRAITSALPPALLSARAGESLLPSRRGEGSKRCEPGARLAYRGSTLPPVIG